jgi:hypothetical protein
MLGKAAMVIKVNSGNNYKGYMIYHNSFTEQAWLAHH